MRNVLIELIFWAHFIIMAFWFGLLFIPTSWWENKIAFHFFLSLSIVGHQFIWGAFLVPWTKKYKMVCLLTTIMQSLRGYKLVDERNFRHAWTREFLERFNIKLPEKGPTIITFFLFTIVTIQYFFFR